MQGSGTTAVVQSRSRGKAGLDLQTAARIVCQAARELAEDTVELAEASRYLLAADRLAQTLAASPPTFRDILLSSPALTELSGRSRTLVEMIEAETGDEVSRLRLAKLLFRALIWRPETFPYPYSAGNEDRWTGI